MAGNLLEAKIEKLIIPLMNRSPERQANEQSFSQGIDVSHLATPHNSYNLGPAIRTSANSTPICENRNEENNNYSQQNNHLAGQSPKLSHNFSTIEHHDRRDNSPNNLDLQNHQQIQQSDNNQPLPSPHPSMSGSNVYDQNPNDDEEPAQNHQVHSQQQQQPIQQQQQQQQQQQLQQQQNNHPQVLDNQQQLNIQKNQAVQNNGTSTKLSYEIISVREPLSKILAEQHRQLLGDHEYIEVYGERGSSCFYEEIAGSTTSSATYDQIGAASNHNYQALINAYAVTNRTNDSNRYNMNDNNLGQPNNHNSIDNVENIYNLEQSNDLVDSNQPTSSNPIPSTSTNNDKSELQNQILKDRNNIASQSIPVYSVINKATRRNNAIIRATMENCRPPQPPPKNLPMIHQSSSSAIQHYQESSVFMNNQCGLNSRNSPQIPTTSNITSSAPTKPQISKDSVSESKEVKEKHSRLPQPPPRYSKQPLFDATRRPLPKPDNCNDPNKNESSNQEEDIESLNNGYELLNTNFDEDQIDVGYEKIRDSHQYSGGSLSSHFNPLQLIDNGGYESVQPIYSSPSNALAEPNYEAIGPATASELAAAATARLNAVIDFLKQDQ